MVGRLMGLPNGEGVAWSSNATEAANIIIQSLDIKGKRVLVSPLEHNCTVRPLVAVGAEIVVMPCGVDGRVDINRLKEAFEMGSYDDIALIVVNHQSNVNGVIQPIKEIFSLSGSVPVMVDTAQSLGYIPFNANYCDYAIFTGHKGLYAPTGCGGLYAKDTQTLKPLIYGGTGSNSASYNMPLTFPEFLEVGTLNSVAIAGLKAALESEKVVNHTFSEFIAFRDAVGALENIELFAAESSEWQGELFSFRHNSIDGSMITYRLESEYGIACRFGLHCSAMAHTTLNTTDSGLVRVSPSGYHTNEDFAYFLSSLKSVLL